MKSAQVRKISAVVIGLTVAGSAIAWGGHDGGRISPNITWGAMKNSTVVVGWEAGTVVMN